MVDASPLDEGNESDEGHEGATAECDGAESDEGDEVEGEGATAECDGVEGDEVDEVEVEDHQAGLYSSAVHDEQCRCNISILARSHVLIQVRSASSSERYCVAPS